MKKILSILLAVLFAAFVLAGCVKRPPEQAPDTAGAQTRHQESQDDLQKEENARQQPQEEEEEGTEE